MPPRSQLKPRKTPRQARAKVTVEAILDAAAQVFQRHGYAAGTTDRIAERAGVSIGSLYQYFPNKDAILVALAERHFATAFTQLRSLLAEVQAKPPELEPLLHRFVEATMALHTHEPELHRVLFEETPLPASLRRDLKRQEDVFAAEIGHMLAALPARTIPDPMLAAHILVQTVEGLVHGFILHPPPNIDETAFTDEVVHLLHRYLTGSAPD